MTILVGTSGWSYDDWVGPVYPPASRSRPASWFGLYAERFSTVEINSTFYRLPSPTVVDGWIAKVRKLGTPFEFSAKVPEAATHDAIVAKDAVALRAEVEEFRTVVADPLDRKGLFGAALLQLSPHFHRSEEGLALLDTALAPLEGLPTAVEFRHRTWTAEGGLPADTRDLLAARSAVLASVDGPGFPPLLEPDSAHVYVRFHGRRPDAWFRSDPNEDLPARYDYLYSEEELRPWTAKIREISRGGRTVRVYFNNHVRGQAVTNAEQVRDTLGLPRPVRRRMRLDDF